MTGQAQGPAVSRGEHRDHSGSRRVLINGASLDIQWGGTLQITMSQVNYDRPDYPLDAIGLMPGLRRTVISA